jgi:L,D-transpeptidase YcbB
MRLKRRVVVALAIGLGTASAAAQPIESDAPEIRIELPEPPEPAVVLPDPAESGIETGAVAPVGEPVLDLPLPEPAPEVVVRGEPATVVVPPPDPPEAVVIMAPPVPPQAPAAPAVTAAIPAETLKTALQRLRTGGRLSDREATAALGFYESRGFAPLFVEDGQWNARASAVRARLAAAGEDGLDPRRYRSVAAFHASGEPFFPALAAAEAQLAEAAILYARDAAIGRVRPQQIHELITPRLSPPAAEAVLAALADAAEPSAALQAFNPPHPEYVALRRALAEAQANRPTAQPGEPIPEGPALRVGMRDARVPLIRARLGLEPDPPGGQPLYDRETAVKVAMLQKENGLPVNGLFTPATRRALLGEGPTIEEAEIVAAMEFWRWMPRDLGAEHILVNAPALESVLRRDGAVAHRSRIIIGKRETQTPFFSDVMDHIVVNPSWHIPPGILKREPKYLDPLYAATHGYEIVTRGTQVSVRMPPGASNALGYVKFMFPNEHAVYLHDTPNRRLFNAQNRALSNGCVRVENPFQLAAQLFASEGWTEERLKRLAGGGERRMNLPRKLPIHLAYFTVEVGADGRILRHPDVYGHAARMRQLLGLS